MNVLHLISSRLGYYGAERMVVALSGALEELGIRSVVAAFHDPRAPHLEVVSEAQKRGLITEQILCEGRLDWNSVRTLREIVVRHNIAVIHCHGIKPILYALIAGRQGAALISTCHLWTFGSGKEWALSALERCMLHFVDRIVVVSDQILPQLHRFRLKADVIYNGIDMGPIADTASAFRQKMGWNGRPVIGAIARLAPQKGLQYLLRAAPEVLRSHPNALFVFAGDGPQRESLETEATSLGIQNSISFLGVRSDTPDIFASIDVLAMPSVSEGLPMALLEAMAAAKPVVATAVGAIPKVIKNRVNGILLSPGDTGALAKALQELLNSGKLRSDLGCNARNTVEAAFSAESMALQYVQAYTGVIFQ